MEHIPSVMICAEWTVRDKSEVEYLGGSRTGVDSPKSAVKVLDQDSTHCWDSLT